MPLASDVNVLTVGWQQKAYKNIHKISRINIAEVHIWQNKK
jgi:hypothetical protein